MIYNLTPIHFTQHEHFEKAKNNVQESHTRLAKSQTSSKSRERKRLQKEKKDKHWHRAKYTIERGPKFNSLSFGTIANRKRKKLTIFPKFLMWTTLGPSKPFIRMRSERQYFNRIIVINTKYLNFMSCVCLK